MFRFLFVLAVALAASAQTAADGPVYAASGKLQLPSNYREWVYLSSGLGMTYGPAAQADQGHPMFDNVFVNPSSHRAFMKTGNWPDKTMFILEVRSATAKGSINNGGHYQSGVVAVEAAVKDETRFPQKWAYFGFEHGVEATALPATSGCNTCHTHNAAVENTFVQFYPTLLEVARNKKTLNPSFKE